MLDTNVDLNVLSEHRVKSYQKIRKGDQKYRTCSVAYTLGTASLRNIGTRKACFYVKRGFIVYKANSPYSDNIAGDLGGSGCYRGIPSKVTRGSDAGTQELT